jgi:hypothetical protein
MIDKKVKYLSKTVTFGSESLTLYSIDGQTWSTRKEELIELKDRLENDRVTLVKKPGFAGQRRPGAHSKPAADDNKEAGQELESAKAEPPLAQSVKSPPAKKKSKEAPAAKKPKKLAAVKQKVSAKKLTKNKTPKASGKKLTKQPASKASKISKKKISVKKQKPASAKKQKKAPAAKNKAAPKKKK